MPKVRKEIQPDFIRATELVQRLGLSSTQELYEKVRKGDIPPWHSRIGERTALWRRDHYQQFYDTGFWPEAAWRHKPASV